jgi:hypothetical protein
VPVIRVPPVRPESTSGSDTRAAASRALFCRLSFGAALQQNTHVNASVLVRRTPEEILETLAVY